MKKRILVFDDEETILEVTKIILQDCGYQVRTFTHFKNFYQKINRFKPNAILIDLWMPDVNGQVIVKKLKKSPQYQSIPIIVLSASKHAPQIAKESGANDCLCKPFDIYDLENIVRKYA